MTSRTCAFGASAIAILWAFSACSSGSTTAAPADASVDAPLDAGTDTASDAPPPCNMVANTAPIIGQQYAAGEPPAPTGGTITDGTYFVTAATVFTADAGASGPTGILFRQTNMVSGKTFQIATGSQSKTQTGTFTTNGTAINIAISCPAGTPAPPFVTYDADGHVIRVYSARSDAGVTSSFTYTKQ